MLVAKALIFPVKRCVVALREDSVASVPGGRKRNVFIRIRSVHVVVCLNMELICKSLLAHSHDVLSFSFVVQGNSYSHGRVRPCTRPWCVLEVSSTICTIVMGFHFFLSSDHLYGNFHIIWDVNVFQDLILIISHVCFWIIFYVCRVSVRCLKKIRAGCMWKRTYVIPRLLHCIWSFTRKEVQNCTFAAFVYS